MANTSLVTAFKGRHPSLSLTDETISLYLDDSIVEMPRFGIGETDSDYDKLVTLYTAHLMSVAGLIKQTTSESVKDVSATYRNPNIKEGSTYYTEFVRTLKRRSHVPWVIHQS